MEIVKMNSEHYDAVFKMTKDFYSSDAVDHEIPDINIKNTINNALTDGNLFDGYVFSENNEIIGFAYVTQYFETEVGGMCVMILDLYIKENFRRHGYGTAFFEFVFEKYKSAKRFRLEVAKDNIRAIGAYKKLGFKDLSYNQMVIDL